MNLQRFSKIPKELQETIISFVGNYKKRNGRWMHQLDPLDKRFKLYDKIPKPDYQEKPYLPYTDYGIHISFFVGKKKRGYMELVIFPNFYDKKNTNPFDPYNVKYYSKIEMDYCYKKEEIENFDNKEIVYLCKPTMNHQNITNDYSNKDKMIWLRR
jgi:hypothetical protein